MRTNEETEGIPFLFAVLEKGAGFRKNIRIGIGFLAYFAQFLKGVALVRSDVRFSQQGDPAPQGLEIMNDALGALHRLRMVR